MSRKIQVILMDDVDGSEAKETVAFAIDGVDYEIDLSEANAKAIREAFAPWVGHARRVAGRAASRGKRVDTSPAAPRPDLAAMRAWARENGYAVSDVGRLSATVRSAYEAAH